MGWTDGYLPRWRLEHGVRDQVDEIEGMEMMKMAGKVGLRCRNSRKGAGYWDNAPTRQTPYPEPGAAAQDSEVFVNGTASWWFRCRVT